MSMDTDIDEDPENWKTFHNTTREYVIFLLLFIFLYVTSYSFIGLFRKKLNSYPDCYEDAFANRISLWLSSFSLSISIGAALLLPISIISNEVLLLYPNSYYVQWLNTSLIQGLWNLVFLFSNLSLFLFLPFSHFIMESEGFPGSSKGIMARVNEALLVLGLIGLVIMGTIYIVSAIFDSGPYIQSAFTKSWKSNLDDISSYYLPFLYSCVSFLGVLMLLLCTPLGFARLFSVMADLLMKRKENFHISELHTKSCIEKANKSCIEKAPYNETHLNDLDDNNPAELSNDSALLRRRNIDSTEYLQSRAILLSNLIREHQTNPESFRQDLEKGGDTSEYDMSPLECPICSKYFLDDEGKTKFSISSMRRNCLYPFVMLLLLMLTIISVLMVTQNTLELCFGIKSLPIYSQNISLGISSLSALGPVGAALEIIMILYLWCTSIVGFYSLPFFRLLKPKLSNTSLTQVIGNCAVLLVLSSALPVLARSLGITNFDLLGDFGRINWLGNFYIVLFHNIVFAVTVALCLGTKITSSVRKEIYERLCSFSGSPLTWLTTTFRF